VRAKASGCGLRNQAISFCSQVRLAVPDAGVDSKSEQDLEMSGTKETTIEPAKGDALVVVDVQNDFLPGGALAVPQSDEILPVVNSYIAIFEKRGLPIYLTRDWHPADHCSFNDYGGPWPTHCVAGSSGAAFSSDFRA
jgi:hypothetical protein